MNKLRYQVTAFGSGNMWLYWNEPTREHARSMKKYLESVTEVRLIAWHSGTRVRTWIKVLIWDREKEGFIS